MKKQFTSLNGAITLSFVALLIELFHGFIDSMFVYPMDFPGTELMIAAGYAVIMGVWIQGLLAARGGNRLGLITALSVGLLLWVGQDWMTILVFCPNGCNSMWSSIAAWIGLVVGGLALVALGLQIWRKPASISRAG